ncbi:hypothetical protein HPP92_004273 [Vanilla planifolia]|uniref:Uncharacterized protein n=1 Tax=Vanilla planifolia TaxID=51239 RepID=A0A835RKS2_VANPL|nr:hypothetical protein HPP92_004273 [Vanilla planifolia]
MPEMNLGALKEMPEIRSKACNKLYHKREQCSTKLLSSYKGMVIAAIDLVKASGSMRCYLRDSGSSSIIKYSDEQEDPSDHGDGGGIPVFSCFSISFFEDLAGELVKMFTRELSLKRFLVMDLLFSTSMEDGRQEGIFSWSDELYTGEFNDLRSTGMLVHDGFYLSPPQIMDWQSSDPSNREPLISPSHEVLQVYLTTWLADLNIEMNRVSEIFSVVGDAIGVKLA